VASIVESLEATLIPTFEKLAERLNEVTGVRATVFSLSVGHLTDYQGHTMGVSCLLWEPKEEEDTVALSVDLAYLTTSPRVSAIVCWGHPSGKIEAEWRENSARSIELSDEALEELVESIPRLCDSLIEAVRSGAPSNS